MKVWWASILFLFPLTLTAANAAELVVRTVEVDDLKAVFGQVTSVDRTQARSRIAGTIVALTVDEGDRVKAGQVIATVRDEKLRLQAVALAARLKSLGARKALATTNLARAEELRRRGTISQARLDQARTALDVAGQEAAALAAEQSVLAQRRREGAVLAPASGRVLKILLIQGSVVAPGEEIALIAAERYVLRLRLPERHAKFVRVGDTVKVGARGLGVGPATLAKGRIRQIYPEIRNGRVIADVDVPGLGDFFVGERVRVWLATGKRAAIILPRDYIGARFGLSYARLADGTEVIVQTGPAGGSGLEILSGLRPGDRVVKP